MCNKTLECKATVKQVGNNFTSGRIQHCHPPIADTATASGISTEVREKAAEDVFQFIPELVDKKESSPNSSLKDSNPSSSTSKENVVTNGGIRCAPLSTLLADNSFAPKRKKKVLTLSQKLQIIKKLDEGASLKELASEYNVGVLTICKIYKKKDTINPVISKWGADDATTQIKTDKSSKFSDLDKVMLQWLQEVREVKKPLKYSHVLARAKHLYKATTGSMEGFTSSKGWWRLFRRQNGLHKGGTLDFGVKGNDCNKTDVKEKPFVKASEESESKSSQIGDQLLSTKLEGEMAQIKYTTAVDCIKTVISYLKQDTNTPYSLIQDAQSIYEHIMSQCKLKKQKTEGDVVANGCQWPSPDADVTSPSQKSSNIDTGSPVLRPRQRKRRVSADKNLTSWSCTISAPPANSIRLKLKGPSDDEETVEGKHQCSECEATFDEAAQLEIHVVTHFTKQEPVPHVAKNVRKGDRKVNINGHRREQNRYNGEVHKGPLSPVTRLSVSGSYKAKDLESDSDDECQDLCYSTLPKKRRHRCLYCAKIFPKSAHLASHLRTHANKVFSCDVCGIAFDELSDLKKHCEEVHAILDSPGEKPFKCMLCDRLFKKKCHLIWHIQNHSFSSPVKVETPFKCELCNRAFKLKCNLMWHQRTHRELVEEKVKICDSPPPLSDDIKDNLGTEVDNFPFRCQVCKRTFRKNCNLKVHEKTHSHLDLSAGVNVKCEDADSLSDDVVDGSLGLNSVQNDVSYNLVKNKGGQKDKVDDSVAPNTEYKLSKRKLNTIGKDNTVNRSVAHRMRQNNRPNYSQRHNAKTSEKSLNHRGKRSIVKHETANSPNSRKDELLDSTDGPNIMKDSIMNSTDTHNFNKDAQNLVKGTPSLTEDTINLTEDAQNLIKNTQNLTRDTQNLIEDTLNLTENTQNLTENTQDLTENTQNLTENTQDLIEDTQNLTENTQDLTEDSQNLTENTQDLTENTQDLTENTQDLTENTQDLTENTQDLTENTQDLTESIQDNTEITQNLIKDGTESLIGSLDMTVDDSSNISKPEISDMDDSLEPGVELPFRCKFCPRSFKKNCNLKWHEKCHSKKRLKRSSFWDDSCSEGDDLDDLELPTDLYPFKCDECGRAFKMNCHLKRHQKTHIHESDEEPEIIDDDENYVEHGKSRRSGIRRCVRKCVVNSYDVNKVNINQFYLDRPNTNRLRTSKPRVNTSRMSTPEVNRFDTDNIDKPDVSGSEVNIPNVNGSDIDSTIINEPNINTSSVDTPTLNRTNMNESHTPNRDRDETSQPEINQPEISRPETSQDNINRAEVSQLNINRAEESPLNINRAEVSQLNINRDEVSQLNINRDEVSQLNINRDEVSQLNINRDEVSQLNINTPDKSRPSVNGSNGDRFSISNNDQENSYMHIDEDESNCFGPDDIESLIKKEIEEDIEEYDAYIDSIVKVEHDVTFDVLIKEEPDETFELECY
ncbi:uncharacterized protein LOC143029228 isoform X2 [Oratosquilla oratoria]